MKLYFMKRDAVDFMKHNMDRLYTHYFHDKNNNWMEEEYGSNPFTEFMEVPDFELADVDAMSIGEADFENCKILYNNLRMLSESQCSDERLWAGLCNGTFYDYMRQRYQYPTKHLKKKETDVSAIISRFFFSVGEKSKSVRSGFYRNTLAKCWWVGRATFDKENPNHFERLDVIGANDLTTKISDIFYSNTFSSNPVILAGICDALKYFSERGQVLDEKEHVRAAMKYLNAVGGVTLLDMLTREKIRKIMISRIITILKGQSTDIDFDDTEDDDQMLEEVLEDDDSEEIAEKDGASDINDDANVNGGRDSFAEEKKEESESITATAKALNWFDEVNVEKEMPGPEYITYGCWVKVLNERDDKVITYHLPLKNDKITKWFIIMEKMMGQNVGYRMFLSGRFYRVLEFGRDENG